MRDEAAIRADLAAMQDAASTSWDRDRIARRLVDDVVPLLDELGPLRAAVDAVQRLCVEARAKWQPMGILPFVDADVLAAALGATTTQTSDERVLLSEALPRGFYPGMTGGLSTAEFLRLSRGGVAGASTEEPAPTEPAVVDIEAWNRYVERDRRETFGPAGAVPEPTEELRDAVARFLDCDSHPDLPCTCDPPSVVRGRE